MSFSLRLHRHNAVRACFALASLAAIGCGTEQLSSPHPGDSPSFAAGGKKAKPTLSGASGPASLAIGGSAGAYTVEITNQTPAAYSNASLQASIEQAMTTSRAAANVPVVCSGSGGLSGVIPTGGCVMTLPVVADNGASGTGILVPGSAKLVINLVQTGSGTTVLDSKTLRISLTELRTAPYISDLVTHFTPFVAGAGQGYTVTLTNPTSATQSIVFVQAYFVQNGVSYAGGGTNVICPILDLNGNLPPGDCTFSWHTSMFPPPNGPVSGQTTWRLELRQSSTSGSVLLDFREVGVTIQ